MIMWELPLSMARGRGPGRARCPPECLGWRIHQGCAMTPVAGNAHHVTALGTLHAAGRKDGRKGTA